MSSYSFFLRVMKVKGIHNFVVRTTFDHFGWRKEGGNAPCPLKLRRKLTS